METTEIKLNANSKAKPAEKNILESQKEPNIERIETRVKQDPKILCEENTFTLADLNNPHTANNPISNSIIILHLKKLEENDRNKEKAEFEDKLLTTVIYTNWKKKKYKDVGNLQKIIRDSQKIYL